MVFDSQVVKNNKKHKVFVIFYATIAKKAIKTHGFRDMLCQNYKKTIKSRAFHGS